VQFIAAGAAIFLLHRAVAPAEDARRIRIGKAEMETLARQWEASHGAPPTAAERRQLALGRARDEALFREALALGLHESDVVVRRRLIQTMEMLSEGTGALPEPTEAELAAYHEAHRSEWQGPPRITLRHVFIDAGRHPQDAEAVARGIGEALGHGANPETLGEPFLRGARFAEKTRDELAGIFGARLAEAAFALPEGRWSAPLASTYGLHLVRVEGRTPPRAKALDEVRAEVRGRLLAERRAEEARRAVARIVAGYAIEIEGEGVLPASQRP
jgi:hypothetical protein